MTQAPYPLVPVPQTRAWLERHPLWKIPLGLLTLVVLMAVFGVGVMSIVTASFRSSYVYQQATAKARDNAEVRQRFGEPVRPASWLISGQLQVNGSTGNANLSIPISGPKAKGVIRAVGYKSAGVWKFTSLQVYVEGSPECIDLLLVQPGLERDF